MKKIYYLIIVCMMVLGGTIQANDTLRISQYQFGFYNQYDLRNSSVNAVSAQRLIQDIYKENIGPRMEGKWSNITSEVFSFTLTYLAMLWSHELGHSLRARQVGGHFKIHDIGLPIPYTTMHLPDSVNLVDEALSVTAGFEVNYLNVRNIQRDFILQDGLTNEDLGFAFANRLMYPLYASLIVPINPEERHVWINTAGDPVHATLPVFKNYSNGQVFMADSTVNPELVDYYQHAAMLASLFNLLDPQFYHEVGASFGDKSKNRKPTFLIGDYQNGWTYGTLFNVSPLGYELYLNNYIHLNGRKFSAYFKYGKPFRNNGVGLIWNEIISSDKLTASASVDIWDQDLFGRGFSSDITISVKFTEYLGLVADAGYKIDGYVLGKQVAKGFNLGIGLLYYGIR